MTRQDTSHDPWQARWSAVLLLVGLFTLLRIVYMAWLCPYSLVEDEAHYWEWSRRLEWSYYSKGPGVAWAIAASEWVCARLGIGSSEFTVRLPSVLMSAVLAIGVAGLARAATGDRRAGFYAAALTFLTPVLQFSGMLMTIDTPYAACWALAAWAAFLALRRESRWAWVGVGTALGAGVLFKYTIVLLLPGIALWAIVERKRLRVARDWRALAAVSAGLAVAGLTPILIWNAQHGWPTVWHLLGHLGLRGGDVAPTQGETGWSYDPKWTLSLIGTQFAMLGLVAGVIIVSFFRAYRLRAKEPEETADRLYLVLCGSPILVFYLLVSFVNEPEGNWPLAAYVTLLALAGWNVAKSVDDWRTKVATWQTSGRPWRGMFLRRPETLDRLLWRLSLWTGVLLAFFAARADWLAETRPMRVVESALKSAKVIRQDRPLVPVGRLMGAPLTVRAAARLRDELSRETGREAFVVAQQYGRASLLAFYMPGRPTVYCSSSKSEGRRTQYDMWPATSLDDPALLGRPAVLVGGKMGDWTPAFESVREFGQLEGEMKRDRVTFVGIGYRGFLNGVR